MCARLVGAVAFFSLTAVILVTTSVQGRAEITESDIRQFEKGKTTYDQVVAKLGKPTTEQYNDEGLHGIAYLDRETHLNAVSTLSIFGSLAGVLMGGQAGVAASSGSLAAETVAGGANSTDATTAFMFDKTGLLMYYRAIVVSASAGTLNSSTATKVISSQDGAAPMPTIKMTITGEQAPWPTGDGKPHLGVRLVPIRKLESPFPQQFASAKFDGLVIAVVQPGGVAEKAGIQVNDYLYVLNGMLVRTTDDMAVAMSTVKLGDVIKAHVKRIDENARLSKEVVSTLHF